ncbi:MAG: bifunctional riboflavin kinase/FMN adenylyltransferase [Clostridiales Family XIII bacterium]|jgi:riboflavin kinase/FMN adenylyltransferase|nr:bifunctional riboflavin kinase/FMN adenylyltransferase [Clostridiales Family XIII bacterium]
MKIFTDLKQIKNIPPTSIALGNFDGVHLGHAELIRRAVAYAKERGLAPTVFTFSNLPYNVLRGKTVIHGVASEADKERMLESLGIEYLFSLSFDEGFHTMTPGAFVDGLLLGAFNSRAVFCGFNFRFGAEAAGDPGFLRKEGEAKGFDLVVMEPYKVGDALVSSTMIRGLIERGDMVSATRFLGRPFSIEGEITHGNGLGRDFGFPTANIGLPEELVVPAYGVYVTESRLCEAGDNRDCESATERGTRRIGSSEGGFTRSVTNVGVRPTIGDHKLFAETHILGAPDDDLYGRRIRVAFLDMVRPERRFADIGALKAQVESDKQTALEY